MAASAPPSASSSTGAPKMIAGEGPPPPLDAAEGGRVGFGSGGPGTAASPSTGSMAARPSASARPDVGLSTPATALANFGSIAAVPYPASITTSRGLALLNLISLSRNCAYGPGR